ncbi:hypothetical protein Cri9333_1090 [Crinalium epipsammum PCC 9333]|uniref:DUF7925 domain-containing protein n=2 Tax=Crinalium TaxID=241421 RepID=K9VVJ8_9CYAN|nr:hypothetical protein Cri9333_1090 [Crinalium epipsammum PCC 9333]
MQTHRKNKLYRQLVASALIFGGAFQLVAPVLAEGTPAGTTITNTATGTYDDGNGIQIQTISNTVQITVAEVAGITVSNAGVDNLTASGTLITPGQKGNFKFNVTNTGNDPTTFFIPGADILNGSKAVTNAQATSVTYEILNADGTVNKTLTPNPVPIAAGGGQTASMLPGGQVRVNVNVDVPSNIDPKGVVTVALGKTPTMGDQNVPRGADPNDVYTMDNADGASGEIAGPPVNGVREASAEQKVSMEGNLKQPFVIIKKKHTFGNNNNAGVIGDTLKYDFGLTVLNTRPANAPPDVTATEALQPTFVPGLSTKNGTTVTNKHVLISDVIPAGTVLDYDPAVPATLPQAPTDWTAVYSTDDPGLTGTPSYKATWSKTAPADPTTVKRIGFVYTADTAVSNNGVAIENFNFTVKFTGSIQQGAEIANIAQVFGEKTGVTPSDTTVPSIFDESGDADHNNDSNGDGSPDLLPSNTTGIANPSTQGVDTNNDNSGTGPAGEANVYKVGLTAGVLNGTVITAGASTTLHPDAVGPTSNNDDFTNRASAVAPNKVPVVTFSNSIQNKSGGAASLSLIPQAVDLRDLPVGTTIITIGDTLGNKVTYTANQSVLNNVPSVTASGNPLTFANVAADDIKQYEVTVDLPENTPQNVGYDVPITAFVDSNANNLPDGNEAQNKTIDRVYAGFLSLLKETQVIDGDATTFNAANFSINPKKAAPGQKIVYRVTYKNISEAEPTSPSLSDASRTTYLHNVFLSGQNITLTEDGTTGGNNWAIDQNGDNIIDTSHVGNTATQDSRNSSIKYYVNSSDTSFILAEPATNSIVSKYVDPVTGVLKGGEFGTFIFQRRLN